MTGECQPGAAGVRAAGLHLDRAEIIAEDEGGDERFLWIIATRPST